MRGAGAPLAGALPLLGEMGKGEIDREGHDDTRAAPAYAEATAGKRVGIDILKRGEREAGFPLSRE